MTKTEVMALFVDDVEARKSAIHAFIADKTNSREDRLEVYLNTPAHLQGTDCWVWEPKLYQQKFGRLEWYDDKWCYERRQEVDICETIADYIGSKGEANSFLDWDDEDEDNKIIAKEKMELLIDDALNDVCHSFLFDW